MLDQTFQPGTIDPPARAQLFDVVRSHLPLLKADAELDESAPLRGLGLTSMRAVDLLLDIEEALDVSFPDTELTAENFETAAALWQVAERLLETGGG